VIFVLHQMGYTALMLAAEAGHKDVLHILIDKARKNEKLPSKFMDMKNKVWMVWKLFIGFLVDWLLFCQSAVQLLKHGAKVNYRSKVKNKIPL
jgi:ankyrin repeat protein